jgi:polyferredoxin
MTQPVPIKIYPRLTSGRFNNIRVALVILTQLVFLGLPWLQWNHRQAVLFDLERHQFLCLVPASGRRTLSIWLPCWW